MVNDLLTNKCSHPPWEQPNLDMGEGTLNAFVNSVRTTPKEQLVLFAIGDREVYGLEIQRIIERATNGREKISIGSLYPILHGLGKQELVVSRWGEESTCGARRRYYSLSQTGRAVVQNILDTQKRLWKG